MSLSQAQQLFRQGRLAAAERSALALLGEDAANPSPLLLLGAICHRTRRGAEAVEYLGRAARLAPDRFATRFALGRLLADLGLPRPARSHLEAALELRPDNPETLLLLGSALHGLDESEQAERHLRRALELRPDSTVGWNELGVLSSDLGRFEEAQACYRKALELAPGLVESHYNYANLHSYRKGDPHIGELRALLDSGEYSGQREALLHFALGKALDELADYAPAGACFARGNAARRGLHDYDTEASRRTFAELRRIAVARGAPADGEGRNLVFIVGMPRSGTTLAERILASHSGARGIGEAGFFSEYLRGQRRRSGLGFPAILDAIRDDARRRVARRFEEHFRAGPGDDSVLVDKTASNYLHLGFLRGLFPRARFVYARRDPRAVCFSIWRRVFPAPGHGYAYDARELGEYYLLYQELMDFWRERLPGELFELRYERLVAEPEREIRALLEHCGLPFEPACLEFHRHAGAVRTASGAQVRQPLYAGSDGHWRHYAEPLAPLLRLLERGRAAGAT